MRFLSSFLVAVVAQAHKLQPHSRSSGDAMRISGRTLIAALCSLSFVCEAQAATVTLSKGSGAVDRGTGFQAFVGPQTVASGDRIIVNAGSEGLLDYGQDCPVKVEPGMVVTVLEISPCKGAALTTQAVPAAVPAAGLSTGLVVGGIAVAVGVGVLVATGRKKSPSSP